MFKRRSILFLSTALLAGSVAISGCSTFTPAAAQKDVQTAATIAAKKAMQLDTNAKAYVQSVEVVVEAALNDGSFEPDVLKASLANISVKELRDPTIAGIISDVFDLYQAQFGDVVAKGLDKNTYARPILEGLRDGLKAALSGS
jgi:hypothetical protein